MFGVAPVLVALPCTFGVVGGLTAREAFIPIYAIGLIFGVTIVTIYAVVMVARGIRWLTRRC